MLRKVILAMALLCAACAVAPPPVQAQQAVAIASCGSPPIALDLGVPHVLYMDATGVLCTSSSGGGGAGTIDAHNFVWTGTSWVQAQGLTAGTQDTPSTQVIAVSEQGRPYAQGQTPISCGVDVAAAAATCTLGAAAGVTTYLTGFSITGGGATAASVIKCTVTGLISGTQTYAVPVPAGAPIGIAPLQRNFSKPIPASAANTAIVVSCPSFGTGNTVADVNAEGFRQ